MLVVKVLGTAVVILGLLFGKTLIKLRVTKRMVDRELSETIVEKISSPGSIKEFRLMPVIDYFSDNSDCKTEAGVAYYIQADDTTILMDLGANGKKEHPSPLINNMKILNKKTEDLDFIFISHAHLDHIGGMKEQKQKKFSLSQGAVDLPAIPVYTPEPLVPSEFNPQPEVNVIKDPVVLKDGIISIGSIPRALYLMGYTVENSLAFNVEGKGIVLVIGCGHQTIEKIVERAKALFDLPIYGIIGGLHLPAGGGRIKLGPVDIQPLVGCDRPPWNAINKMDTEEAIKTINAVDPAIIALSPHDSSDDTLNRFREEFGDRYSDIKVGNEIVISG